MYNSVLKIEKSGARRRRRRLAQTLFGLARRPSCLNHFVRRMYAQNRKTEGLVSCFAGHSLGETPASDCYCDCDAGISWCIFKLRPQVLHRSRRMFSQTLSLVLSEYTKCRGFRKEYWHIHQYICQYIEPLGGNMPECYWKQQFHLVGCLVFADLSHRQNFFYNSFKKWDCIHLPFTISFIISFKT